MLAFTNNSSPLFIIGTVGITLFKNITIGILLFLTHILSSITVGIILKFFSKKETSYNNKKINTSSNVKSAYSYKVPINFSDLGEILGNCIKNSITTTLMIGGFIVLFSVILSILNNSKVINMISTIFKPIFDFLHIPNILVSPFFSGIIELTNGISLISNIAIKSLSLPIILSAFLLGFGGFSILLQIFSIVSKSGLSIKKYILGKLMQGFIAAIYTFIAIKFFPFLSFII